MHLTLKKQVINSCYPGWRLILLAFIFRRGERFILAELWLLVRDTERGEHARWLGRRSYGEGEGGTAEPGLQKLQKDGGDGDSSQSVPRFQAAAEPSLRAAALLPGPPAWDAGSRADAPAWRCRALPPPLCSVPGEGGAVLGGCLGAPVLSRNSALGFPVGHRRPFAAEGKAGAPGLSPAPFRAAES